MGQLYTRKGDQGKTNLLGGTGSRSKSSPIFDVLGTLDELSAAIGLSLTKIKTNDLANNLRLIQEDLLTIGAFLADPRDLSELGELKLPIDQLERLIDQYWNEAGDLKDFILPGGENGGAELHLARAITRRLERVAVKTNQDYQINPEILAYCNRLSDFLFAAARVTANQASEELIWRK